MILRKLLEKAGENTPRCPTCIDLGYVPDASGVMQHCEDPVSAHKKEGA